MFALDVLSDLTHASETSCSLFSCNSMPSVLEIRRITGTKPESNTQPTKSAAEYTRKQAMIAAAEAREKAHKAKLKPIPKINKDGRTLRTTEEQRQLEKDRMDAMVAQTQPMSDEAKKAMEQAKAGEAALAAELGYNPYETARSSAGQARNATATAAHGSISAAGAGDHLPSSSKGAIPTVAAPVDPVSASSDGKSEEIVEMSPEFEDAYCKTVSTNSAESVKVCFGILRKLLANATTKGQCTDDPEAAAKFRRVRLSNAKIKAAIVDVDGAVEMMLAAGFQLVDDGGESFLLYPEGYSGPDWLRMALAQLEQYENSK